MNKYCCDIPMGKPCDSLKNNFDKFPYIYCINSSFIEELISENFPVDFDNYYYGNSVSEKIYKCLEDAEISTSCYYICSEKILNKLEHYIKEDLCNITIYDNYIGGIMYSLYFYFGNPLDNRNELKKLAKINFDKLPEKRRKWLQGKKIKNEYISSTEIEQTIKSRRGQNIFKKKLLQYDCKCKICGLDMPELLIASHSKPWIDCTDYERLDVYNGFLLCRQHDGLFDKGYISFDDDGKILISNSIDIFDYKLLLIDENIKIDIVFMLI